jgi:lysozyme
MTINPKVIDLYHGDTVTSFEEVYKAGIRGVIHKATEGQTILDRSYATRREQALDEGLLWGAYHFLRPGNMKAQAQRFLDVAQPSEATLIAVDHEDPKVSLHNLFDFLTEVAAETGGREGIIYSGFLIKEQLGSKPTMVLPYRLWLAQYSANPKWPSIWEKPFLWQYTGDGSGPEPHSIPGIHGNIDISSFDGSDEDLAKQWAS